VRVFLIGSTGVLGREAVPRLLAAGHTVTGLARNADRVPAVTALGIEPAVADLFDTDSLAGAMRGHDAVLNLATRIPAKAGSALKGWRENDRIRTVGSTCVVDAALRGDDVRVIVQEGISFLYADGGDTPLDEDAPVHAVSMLRSSVVAHDNVARFAQSGRTGVGLRIALLMDPIFSSVFRSSARLGGPVIVGDPDGYTTVIRPADAAAGAVATLGAPSGIYNVGATPLRKADFGALVAQAAGRKRARHLPSKLALGPLQVFARSQRVVSDRLTEATGWRPEQPEVAVTWLR
jgi:nucleoside-diphosphate-sugar epimerase